MYEQLDLFLTGDTDAIQEHCENLFDAGHQDTAWGLYRASRPFQLLKRARKVLANGHCEACKQPTTRLQMHHLTYQRRFHEALEDVRMVCRPCHEFLAGMDLPDAA